MHVGNLARRYLSVDNSLNFTDHCIWTSIGQNLPRFQDYDRDAIIRISCYHQAIIGLHVVEKLELGGWMWNQIEEVMMNSTLVISKSGGQRPDG